MEEGGGLGLNKIGLIRPKHHTTPKSWRNVGGWGLKIGLIRPKKTPLTSWRKGLGWALKLGL